MELGLGLALVFGLKSVRDEGLKVCAWGGAGTSSAVWNGLGLV